MRPLHHFLVLGLILGALTLAALEYCAPWGSYCRWNSIANENTPTAEQRQAALDAGWLEGTDGFYRAIYGPGAY